MGKKVISFGLSQKSIKEAIRQIEEYKEELNQKVVEFTEALAKKGELVALSKIEESPLGRKTITLRSETTQEDAGCKVIIVATGQTFSSEDYPSFNTLLAVEFGSGIHHNPEPNPKANELGYGVGTFPGQTHAFEDGWYYLGEDDKWHYTHGVKATMPMYSATVEIANKIQETAKEVFG